MQLVYVVGTLLTTVGISGFLVHQKIIPCTMVQNFREDQTIKISILIARNSFCQVAKNKRKKFQSTYKNDVFLDIGSVSTSLMKNCKIVKTNRGRNCIILCCSESSQYYWNWYEIEKPTCNSTLYIGIL